MRVELFKNKRGKWQHRLRARNGKIVYVSEEYQRKSGARKSAMSASRQLSTAMREIV